MEELTARWTALVEAVQHELLREGEARELRLSEDLRTLRLCAQRPLDGGRQETITVRFTAGELLTRAPAELAREFARAYYACT